MMKGLIQNLTTGIFEAANNSVPHSKGSTLRTPVPWWNEECAKAIILKKKAHKIIKKFPTQRNLSSFRRIRAKSRQVLREAKMASWIEIVGSINNRTPISQVWRKVRCISGSRKEQTISYLQVNGDTVTAPSDICDVFGISLSKIYSSENYDRDFDVVRNVAERQTLNFKTNSQNEKYDPFSLWELTSAIGAARDSSPGIGGIHNSFLRNRPKPILLEAHQTLNQVWSGEVFLSLGGNH
jgi:hypothetical protein